MHEYKLMEEIGFIGTTTRMEYKEIDSSDSLDELMKRLEELTHINGSNKYRIFKHVPINVNVEVTENK